MEYLFIISTALSFLFLLILITNKGKRTEHWLLSAIFVLIILSSIYIFILYIRGGNFYLPVYSEFNYSIPMLFGVLLWLYARSLTSSDFKLDFQSAVHFLPFLVFFITILLFYFGSDDHQQLIAKNGYPVPKLIINGVYIFATLRLLITHKKRLYEQFSHIDKMHYFWLQWISYGGVVLFIVACIGNIYNLYKSADDPLLGDYFLTSVLGIYLFILGYVGFNRTNIFQQMKRQAHDLEKSKTSKIAVESVSAEDMALLEKVREVMATEKPYLNPELSLYELSKIADLSPSRLSVILNTGAKQNFYDFVNAYRVKHFLQQLNTENLREYSLLGLAMQSGFNSKASFNRIFKKSTGKTPTSFLESVKKP